MPFFKRNNSNESHTVLAEEVLDLTPVPGAVIGTMPCGKPGCKSHEAVQCSYSDKLNMQCPMALCSAHQIIIGSVCYCIRHANTLDAIGATSPAAYGHRLPDVNNRMPTLVRWVARDLDNDLRAFLDKIRLPQEIVQREPIHAVTTADGARGWGKSWHLFDYNGTVLRITMVVNDDDPTRVIIWFNDENIFNDVPPWIVRHMKSGKPSGYADETAELKASHVAILTAVNQSLEVMRPSS